ncbi:MAG: TrmB family transcriptional regulator [Candidatus Woesearchaeota archaeon]
MMFQEELLNKMKAFGLNSYEAKLWMALLSRGVSTAGELSDIANVPRSRSYDVLESLEKKGFIMMKLGKPIKYVAVKPYEVLERVKKRIENDAQTQTMMIDKIKESEVLDELRMLHSKGIETVEPGDLTSSLKGRANIYNHLSSSIKNAKSKILMMTSADELHRIYDNLRKALAKARRNGVEIKIAAPITEDSMSVAKRLSEFAEIRDVANIKSRFCIVDDKEITFMLTDDKIVHSNYDVAVWASSDFFCGSMIAFFNSIWDKSSGYEEALENITAAGAEAYN